MGGGSCVRVGGRWVLRQGELESLLCKVLFIVLLSKSPINPFLPIVTI